MDSIGKAFIAAGRAIGGVGRDIGNFMSRLTGADQRTPTGQVRPEFTSSIKPSEDGAAHTLYTGKTGASGDISNIKTELGSMLPGFAKMALSKGTANDSTIKLVVDHLKNYPKDEALAVLDGFYPPETMQKIREAWNRI